MGDVGDGMGVGVGDKVGVSLGNGTGVGVGDAMGVDVGNGTGVGVGDAPGVRDGTSVGTQAARMAITTHRAIGLTHPLAQAIRWMIIPLPDFLLSDKGVAPSARSHMS